MKSPKRKLAILLGVVMVGTLTITAHFVRRDSGLRPDQQKELSGQPKASPESADNAQKPQTAQAPSESDKRAAARALGDTQETVASLEPTSGCGSFTYKQKSKKDEGEANDELADQKNSIPFVEEKVDTKNICLRMNGIARPFERIKGNLVFGSVADAQAVVSVEFCKGKVPCNLNCKIKQDSFADTLGMSEEDSGNLPGEKAEKRNPAGAWGTARNGQNKNDKNGKDAENSDSVSSIEKEIQDELSVVEQAPVNKDWSVVSRSPISECKN